MSLTSTTAPGRVFGSRAELAEHYKSDWHKYNLKRREAGLPLLQEVDFQARLEAALALRREREGREERNGTDHLKNKNRKQHKNQKKKQQPTLASDGGAVVMVSQAAAYDNTKASSNHDQDDIQIKEDDETAQEETKQQEPPPVIEPRQCLFDKHMSPTVQSNVDRMLRKYDFFIPDYEYLVDLEGFVGYCQEKIKLGHYCLYCQRIFSTWQGCQKHMISTRHTKIRYERGVDMDEFDPFYDFTQADAEFLGEYNSTKTKESDDDNNMEVDIENNDDDSSGEWEDVTDDEEMEDEDDDETEDDEEGLYAGYEDEIAKYGFDVTPLGELIFPDGRIIGHRGLSRYYKQHIRSSQQNDRTAIVAARRAAGERLYNGRVYNMNNQQQSGEGSNNNESSALALARSGAIMPGGAANGGKGILVASGSGGFTPLSLYRYKAVVKKAKRDEARGQRLQHQTKLNTNRMDKKANRLMNNVSVAHAKR